jgi:hypothetical protein
MDDSKTWPGGSGPDDEGADSARASDVNMNHEGTQGTGHGSTDRLEAPFDTKLRDDEPSSFLDARTPIEELELTWTTEMPETAPADTPGAPPAPDLTRFTNPHEWAAGRKNVMLLLSCVATLLTAYSAGAYSPAAGLLAAEFGVSTLAALVGITAFTVGFAAAPMVLAPFSEVNGRYPVFAVSGLVFVLFQAVSALVPSLPGMLVARLLTGVGGSTFSTMVGGVIADIWPREQRNTPMALFSGAVLLGTALGPLVSSVMVQRLSEPPLTGPAAPWKWVFWHQVLADSVLVVAIILLFHESRASVLLVRKARALNEYYVALESSGQYGVWMRDTTDATSPPPAAEAAALGRTTRDAALDDEEKAQSATLGSLAPCPAPSFPRRRLRRVRWVVQEEQHASLGQMIAVSLTRPFRLLCTEPVVFFFSMWVSFAWAALYLTFGSIPLVFGRVYGFDAEQAGYVFVAMVVGALVATLVGVLQERLLRHPRWSKNAGGGDGDGGYKGDAPGTPSARAWAFLRRRFPVEAPESRLYFTCLFSGALPLGLYVFGFTAHPAVPWAAPAVGIGLATAGIYFIYLATFNYLADTYQAYASSAIAAQSFCRNMLGGVFPLVVAPLFLNLGEARAGAVLGAIATALTAVPWVLALFGEKIRRRSRFAVSLTRG